MVRSKLLFDIPQQVPLRRSVQIQTRFIQKNDHIPVFFSHLRERYEEREKPDKPCAPIREWHANTVQVVPDTSVHHRACVERRRISRLAGLDLNLDCEMLILCPVLKDLIRNFIRRGFTASVEILVLYRALYFL
jgi:hypothetical protein